MGIGRQPNLFGIWFAVQLQVFDILGIGDARPVTIANSSLPLCFHMDESAYESPPGLQLLHCIR